MAACACALSAAAAASPAAAQDRDRGAAQRGDAGPVRGAELALVDRPAERFNRAIRAHLKRVERRERRRKRRERRARRRERREAAGAGGAEPGASNSSAAGAAPESVGVSSATLEAIAACESGGNPSAVNPAGYYGKYQFDLGTWQSVGGTGNPAEASESEQDYRAALLYSRAGSSPWPNCGS